MQLDYVMWYPRDLPPVAIRQHAMEGIHQEINESFTALPHRGLETGGVLLGRIEADRIVIEDFEPLPSEHRYGPSYRLSETDCKLLQETLDWFRSGAQPGLSVLGFYRSQFLPEVDFCQEDEDLMRNYFGADENIIVLVKPSLMGTSEANFIIRRCATEEPAPDPVPEPPALMNWPAPRPRSLPAETETHVKLRWPWYAGALVFGLAAGSFGYLWQHPDAGVDHITLNSASPAVPAPEPVKTVSAAAPAPTTLPTGEGTPAPEPDLSGVRELLDRWAGALRRGDVDAAAKCYSPVVTTYFDRHQVSRDAVRQSMRQGYTRYGHLEVYRISGLGITPVDDTRAVATFRKHWQWRTAGHSRSSGEEPERMTLVRNQGAWQISSEQAR